MGDLDELSIQLREEALDVEKNEPELKTLLRRTVLAPHVKTFEDAVACTVSYRLLGSLPQCDNSNRILNHSSSTVSVDGSAISSSSTSTLYNPITEEQIIAKHNSYASKEKPMFCPNMLLHILTNALMSEENKEYGHTMSEAVRLDVLAIKDRDPACNTILEVILFFKGFAALVAHRAARQKWNSSKKSGMGITKSMTALFLQSQASAVFGVDIHPAATIGAGILLDHATGIVIGETAVVGNNCTILHGVTLGGTGKQTGDRHPKLGNDVLIGASASLLGNITIGDDVKIGAGSIVLRSIPSGATAVGVPAKIIGRTKEQHAGQVVDMTLKSVKLVHHCPSPGKNKTKTVASEEEEKAKVAAAVEEEEMKESVIKKVTSDLSISEDGITTRASTASFTSSTATITSASEESDEYENDDDIPSICPFRALEHLGNVDAPKNAITYRKLASTLRDIVKNEHEAHNNNDNITCEQIGELYFALDKTCCGYKVIDKDFLRIFIKLLKEKTNIHNVETIAKEFTSKILSGCNNKDDSSSCHIMNGGNT